MRDEQTTLFVMKPTDGAKHALARWLNDKDFNTFSHGWKDKKGNPGIGLAKRVGKKLEKVSVIICMDDSEQDAIAIVEAHLGYGDENE